MPHDFAPGLPSKKRFDPINQSGQSRLIIQEHNATNKHYDMRLQSGDVAHSWVVRSLPGEKRLTLAIQQPTHRADYMDFEGKIESGYGKGTVKKVYDEQVNVLDANNKRIKMELPEGTFTMIRPKSFKSNNWLMIKKSELKNPITSKPKYKSITELTDYSDNTKVLQPKIDGAHAIFNLFTNKNNDIYSYRNSKKTGLPIEHTNQVPGLRDLKIPKSFDNTVLRGELYATENNKPVSAEIIGGMLNASTEKSLQKQNEIGKLKPYIFDIVKYKGRDVSKEPYSAKFDLMKSIENKVPQLRVAETAFTSNSKRKLVNDIKAGKHSETKEGVVEWDLTSGNPKKLKFRDSHDVYIREIYPSISQSTGKEKDEAGGFRYSWSPKGKIVGNVGTGFSQEKRKDLIAHPEDYIGMVARVKSQQKFSSGALRAPVYYTMDIEKNLDHIKQASFIDELQKIAFNIGELRTASNLTKPFRIHGSILPGERGIAKKNTTNLFTVPTEDIESGANYYKKQLANPSMPNSEKKKVMRYGRSELNLDRINRKHFGNKGMIFVGKGGGYNDYKESPMYRPKSVEKKYEKNLSGLNNQGKEVLNRLGMLHEHFERTTPLSKRMFKEHGNPAVILKEHRAIMAFDKSHPEHSAATNAFRIARQRQYGHTTEAKRLNELVPGFRYGETPIAGSTVKHLEKAWSAKQGHNWQKPYPQKVTNE